VSGTEPQERAPGSPTAQVSTNVVQLRPNDVRGGRRAATELALPLSPAPSAIPAARAAVRESFAGVLGRAVISDLELVVSELVTNGVEHGRGTVRLNMRHVGGEITGSVCDGGSGFVYTPRSLGHDDGPRGRGLPLVDALVTRWGIRRGSSHVWFAIQLGRG
jgi:anti-sigma regulatory factor (Ser/Thr protein kinase)